MSFDKALTVQYLIERPRDWITDVTLRSTLSMRLLT